MLKCGVDKKRVQHRHPERAFFFFFSHGSCVFPAVGDFRGPACLSWLPGGCRGVCPGHTHRSVSQRHGSGVRSEGKLESSPNGFSSGTAWSHHLAHSFHCLTLCWRSSAELVRSVPSSSWAEPLLLQQLRCWERSHQLSNLHALVPKYDCWRENALNWPLASATVYVCRHYCAGLGCNRLFFEPLLPSCVLQTVCNSLYMFYFWPNLL